MQRTTPRLDGEDRSAVAALLGDLAPALLDWFDGSPDAAAHYAALRDDAASLARAVRIATDAPRLIPALREDAARTSALLKGRFGEDRVGALALWVLGDGPPLEEALTHEADVRLRGVVPEGLDVVALGSYGREETSPGSDLNILLLVPDGVKPPVVPPFEGLSVKLDRHDGASVRTYDDLLAHATRGMEPRERFALGDARLVAGSPRALDAVRLAARERPITEDERSGLRRAKRRLETGRVRPAHVRRDVRLGRGGLSDIHWLVRLAELAHPAHRATSSRMPERIAALSAAGGLNLVERDALLDGRRWLLDLRHRLWLMEIEGDLLPENPDRLARLAAALGLPSANDLLRRHTETTDRVRAIYEAGVGR